MRRYAILAQETTPLRPEWTNHLPLHAFMLQDILGSLFATLIFAAVLFTPGYLVGYSTNLLGFRRMPFREQSVWAVNVSFCVAPIGAYLIGRLAGLHTLDTIFAVGAFAWVWLLVRQRHTLRWSSRERRQTGWLVCGWTALVLLLLVDLQVGHRLYFSVVMADQSYRISFTQAVLRTGLPPANPLYFPGALAPMRYFYFWYVLCAVVAQIAHVSARDAFIASSVWAGFGLIAVTWAFGSEFFHWPTKTRWISLALLLVTGADLLPAVGQALLQPALNGDTEWWSVDPIDAWPDSLLWVPHHVASVLCCLLGFLLLWRLSRGAAGSPLVGTFLAGAAFGSAFGLSVYVAFGFALLMVAWLAWRSMTQSAVHRPTLHFFVFAAVVGLSLGAPFLYELYAALPSGGGDARTSATSHIFSLSVRRMIDSGLLTGLPLFAPWNKVHPVLLDQCLRLLLLLPGLAMEMGVFGAALVFLLRAGRRGELSGQDDAHRTALFFAVAGLIMTMFLSSAVITNNDFGYRAVMLPQFFLLLLTADVLGEWRSKGEAARLAPTRGRKRWIYGLLILGAVGSVYWAFLLRAWLPLEVKTPRNGFSDLPDDAYQVRDAFRQLNSVASKDAVLHFRPVDEPADRHGEVMTPNEYFQRMLVLENSRQWLNAEEKCAVHFGGSAKPCSAIQQATHDLYAEPTPDANTARDFCHRFGVSYLIVSARDPQWRDHTGWSAELPAIVVEPRFRIVGCR